MLISHFSKTTGLSRDTIRFYVKLGLLTPDRGTNRYQSFDAAQVERAIVIRSAKALGFTLKEIAKINDEYMRSGMSRARKAAILKERVVVIDAQANKLGQMRNYLLRKIKWVEAGEKGESPPFIRTVK